MWVGGPGAAEATACVILAVNAEAVQVEVVPAHRHLNDTMELRKGCVAAYQDAAPDQRCHVVQDQPELVDAWTRSWKRILCDRCHSLRAALWIVMVSFGAMRPSRGPMSGSSILPTTPPLISSSASLVSRDLSPCGMTDHWLRAT